VPLEPQAGRRAPSIAPVSMRSNRSSASFALLRLKWPDEGARGVAPPTKGRLTAASWTRFSADCIHACRERASITTSAGWVLLTATIRRLPGHARPSRTLKRFDCARPRGFSAKLTDIAPDGPPRTGKGTGSAHRPLAADHGLQWQPSGQGSVEIRSSIARLASSSAARLAPRVTWRISNCRNPAASMRPRSPEGLEVRSLDLVAAVHLLHQELASQTSPRGCRRREEPGLARASQERRVLGDVLFVGSADGRECVPPLAAKL